jgi:hypothetical protein
VEAWCSAYGADTNFWSEKEIGARACSWLSRALTRDAGRTPIDADVAQTLMKSLDVLIRSGVAQAREIEDLLRGAEHRKAS